jgi:hypothetical protein
MVFLGKQLCDVEDVMVWAAGELARKGRGGHAPRKLDVAPGDRELVGRWSKPMGYPPMSPMFAPGLVTSGGARQPPHGDALIVEGAVERLARVYPAPGMASEELAFGMGFAVDCETAMIAALGRAASLVVVFAGLARAPDCGGWPKSTPKRAPNGKPGVWRREAWAEPTIRDEDVVREVEVAVKPMRRGLYPPGSYGVLEWAPSPQSVIEDRAEYAAWRAGLAWLAQELSGALESREVLAPRAPLCPWRDGRAPRGRGGAAARAA